MISQKLINFVVFKYFTTGSAISHTDQDVCMCTKGTVNCAIDYTDSVPVQSLYNL